jgi:5-formyltetrahydrofolate cyclo-ligase
MADPGDASRAHKASLRSRFLAARAALSDVQRAESSAAVCRRLGMLGELEPARATLGFATFGTEPSIDAHLETLLERGHGVFLPWVDGDELGIARVRDLDADLVPGWRGVREPRASGRRRARPDRLDAAIVPGVAFDRQGHRLGYGGGHFDRLLAQLNADAVVVGVCFAVGLAEQLPTEEHDRGVDLVVTEDEVVRC